MTYNLKAHLEKPLCQTSSICQKLLVFQDLHDCVDKGRMEMGTGPNQDTKAVHWAGR